MKRVLLLLFGIVVIVAVAAAGWVAGSRIKSPEQVAAEAEPPEPSLITVPVELQVISTDVVTRGDVRFDQPESVVSTGVALPGVAPVITWVIEAGAEFAEGDVLYEVSGRPVFALEGDIPLFRTLIREAEGEDVAQFQASIARLGFDPGEIDGIYGPKTEAAAADFYEAAGYELIQPSEEEEQLLDAARDAAEQAGRAYDQATQADDAANAAEALVAPAREAADQADAALAAAGAALQAALDAGLPETDPQVIALQGDVAAAETAAAAAAAALADATGAAQAARAQADAFDLAEAQRLLTRANRDLRDARNRVGRKVPVTEILFFERFPLRVDTVNVSRGDPAGGEIMKVSGSRLAIDSSVPIADAEPISVGDAVMIDLASRGIEVTGRVTVKADRPGTNGVDSQRIYLEIVPDEVRAELNEANVRITIPVESTGGAVLAVPAAAISATADGSTQVQVELEDGTTRFVEVIPGLSSRGLVQITPVGGELAEGDRVVVGTS